MALERRLAAVLAADMVGYSRLMERDEDDVLARQRGHRRDLIDPAIAEFGGDLVKTTGDGMLLVFATVHDAVRFALHVQTGMARREADVPIRERIQYRIGINVDDIVFEAGDVFGDGVNVAARLESLAEPGGVCISDAACQILRERLPERFRSLGSQKVKNISRPVKVWQWSPAERGEPGEEPESALAQRIGFCTAPDGVQLAYATVGAGAPVLKAPNWLSHIEYEWRSPVRGPFLAGVAAEVRLVRFDQRGNGLSDREVDEISHDAMLSDMETVVAAAGLETFSILGLSQGCGFSVRYAAQHPERVRCLVLVGGYARGALRRGSAEQTEIHQATTALIRMGWGSPNPAYRHVFTESMMADATAEQKESFDELQRVATSPGMAARINEMNASIDVTEFARKVKAPTLVMHCEGDRRVPFEEGRRLAALIPDARFVALPGNNHALVGGTSTFDAFFEHFTPFIREFGGPPRAGPGS